MPRLSQLGLPIVLVASLLLLPGCKDTQKGNSQGDTGVILSNNVIHRSQLVLKALRSSGDSSYLIVHHAVDKDGGLNISLQRMFDGECETSEVVLTSSKTIRFGAGHNPPEEVERHVFVPSEWVQKANCAAPSEFAVNYKTLVISEELGHISHWIYQLSEQAKGTLSQSLLWGTQHVAIRVAPGVDGLWDITSERWSGLMVHPRSVNRLGEVARDTNGVPRGALQVIPARVFETDDKLHALMVALDKHLNSWRVERLIEEDRKARENPLSYVRPEDFDDPETEMIEIEKFLNEWGEAQ